MCSSVVFTQSGVVCETQGELAYVIGESNFVIDELYDEYQYRPAVCLCPLDLEATGVEAGYRVRECAGEYFFSPDGK